MFSLLFVSFFLCINQVNSVNSEKMKKLSIFNLGMGDGILMKFDVWKDFLSENCYFKSRPDLVTLGGVGGEPKILENTWSGGIRMKLGGKNKHKS